MTTNWQNALESISNLYPWALQVSSGVHKHINAVGTYEAGESTYCDFATEPMFPRTRSREDNICCLFLSQIESKDQLRDLIFSIVLRMLNRASHGTLFAKANKKIGSHHLLPSASLLPTQLVPQVLHLFQTASRTFHMV